jgi:serine protease Do
MLRNYSILAVLLTTLSLVATAAAQDRPARESRRSPVVRVFEQCRDAVVNISTTRVVRVRSLRYGSLFDEIFDFGRPTIREQPVQGIGSGFVVHESGYIVTNGHVVSRAHDVQVIFADKRKLPAEIVAVDPEHDLAVLKVNTRQPLPHLKLGRSDDIMVGETVIAVGNPLGLQHTVTTGIVSALDRTLQFGEDTDYRGLIQTDTAINPGNSGGPLLNINAELIGITTAIRGDAQNVGFAIPVDRLWELVPVMLDIERRERVRFGLQVSGSASDVVAVRPDSPAAKAGLRRGDRVIKFNGKPLRDAIDYYVRLLSHKPGDDIRLTIQRGGQQLNETVALQAIPPPDGRKLAEQLLGMELAEIPAKVRRELELPDQVGLIVDEVVARGPADQAGIRPGDLVLRLDRVTVPTLIDAGLALENVRPQQPVPVEGLRLRADPPFFWTASLRARNPR